jgi:UDP-N-acetylglucosamine pyrophosphorylase
MNFINYNTLENIDLINIDVLNKLAIVKLNGGLGITIKYSKAKGCLEVVDDKNF